MKFFLNKGADINYGNVNGYTPLLYAVEGNKLENVKLLLECGADVEKGNNDGNTIRVLLGKHDFWKKEKKLPFGTGLAAPQITTEENVSASCSASSLNHYDNFFAFTGWSPLHIAAQYGSIEIVQLIFDRVARPDPLSDTKATPLCLACQFNTSDVGEPKL